MHCSIINDINRVIMVAQSMQCMRKCPFLCLYHNFSHYFGVRYLPLHLRNVHVTPKQEEEEFIR